MIFFIFIIIKLKGYEEEITNDRRCGVGIARNLESNSCWLTFELHLFALNISGFKWDLFLSEFEEDLNQSIIY